MRSPIPIAVFLSSFEPGAATRQLIDVARHLDRERFDVHLACVDRDGSMDGIASAAPPAQFPLGRFHHPSAVTQARRFGRWCRERGIAVVHAAGYHAEVFALPAAAFAGVPVRVATRVTTEADRGPARLALRRAAYACAHRVTARTAAVAAQLAREHVPERHVRVITDGIDSAAYRADRQDGPLRRVAVGASAGLAGLEAVIEAAALMPRAVPPFEFVADPRGLPCEDVLARAARCGARVRFEKDSPARLAGADLFVQPGGGASASSDVLEAMASGLPIVAWRNDEISHLVLHQRTGVLVAPADARALAWALLDLVQWPSHARTLGAAARVAAERNHRLDTMVSAFERVYLDVLQARSPVVLAGPHAAAS